MIRDSRKHITAFPEGPSGKGTLQRKLSWSTAAIAVAVLVWLAKSSDSWSDAFSFTGRQGDYYNLLVDGFQAGNLHLKADVHPDLLHPDVEVRKRAPYLLDAGQYNGKYYLYYGVVPAVTVLLPYSAITGHDLSLNVATLGFVLIGCFFSLRWYGDLRRTYCPRTSGLVHHGIVLLLMFGPATTFLVRRSMFYELPLAAGYAFLCIFVWAANRVLERPDQAKRWITIASASVGMAAGCHPNYALLTLFVALLGWWSYRSQNLARGEPTSLLALACAAVVPAAAIGAGLAWYNYARFGNPLEFGFKYGLNVFFSTNDRLLGLDFIWPNLKWYYLTPPTLLPYFPFVFPADATFRPTGYHGAEAIHGQFFVFLTLLWIGLAAAWSRKDWPLNTGRLALILCGSFIISAAFIFLFGIRANRYMVDFQLPLIALGVLLAVRCESQGLRRGFMRLWRVGFATLAVVVAVNNILAATQQFDDFRNTRPRAFERLSKTLNPSWAFWAGLGLVKTGTLVVEASFPAQTKAVGEPLVTVGIPGYSDTVYAIQHPGNLLEFYIDHLGYGGPKSPLFTYEPDRMYRIEIDLGSFHPPKTDPYFAESPSGVIHQVKTNARIVFDGQTALDQSIPFHEAAPWQRAIGSNFISHTLFAQTFSGRILSTEWIPPPPLPKNSTATLSASVLRLALEFPAQSPLDSQPLVGFGITGAGNLLYLQPQSPGKWLMFLDEWGHPSQPPIPVEIPHGFHTMDIFDGPLASSDPQVLPEELAGPLAAKQNRLIIWLDSQFIGSFILTHHLDAYRNPVAGANIQGFSTTTAYFYGQFKRANLTPNDSAAVLQRAKALP